MNAVEMLGEIQDFRTKGGGGRRGSPKTSEKFVWFFGLSLLLVWMGIYVYEENVNFEQNRNNDFNRNSQENPPKIAQIRRFYWKSISKSEFYFDGKWEKRISKYICSDFKGHQ